MDLGSRTTELRKTKNWSLSQLTTNIHVSEEITGRYEPYNAFPTIVLAKNHSNDLGLNLAYLAANDEQKIDKITHGRIQEINNHKDKDNYLIYTFLDAFIINIKLQNIL